MASLTMMAASFLRGGVSVADRRLISHRRSLVVAKAAAGKPERECSESSGRRAVMFAAAASAAGCVVGQGFANAEEEPKPGTTEAKKKYVPICVTMPTARICHK